MGLETNVKLFELLYNKEPNELLTYEDFKSANLNSFVWVEYLTFVEKVKACAMLYDSLRFTKEENSTVFNSYKRNFFDYIYTELIIRKDELSYLCGNNYKGLSNVNTDESFELLIEKTSSILDFYTCALPYNVVPEIVISTDEFRLYYEKCLKEALHEMTDEIEYEDTGKNTYGKDSPYYYDVGDVMSADDIYNLDNYRNFVNELSAYKVLKNELEQKLIEKGIDPFYADDVFFLKSNSTAYCLEEMKFKDFDNYVKLQKYSKELSEKMPFVFKYIELSNTIDDMEYDLENNCKFKYNISMDFKPESILKLNGYSVSETENLTDTQRRQILKDLIDKKIIEKDEVVKYLKSFVNFNGKKLGNSRAVNKWKSDILFLNNYYS